MLFFSQKFDTELNNLQIYSMDLTENDIFYVIIIQKQQLGAFITMN